MNKKKWKPSMCPVPNFTGDFGVIHFSEKMSCDLGMMKWLAENGTPKEMYEYTKRLDEFQSAMDTITLVLYEHNGVTEHALIPRPKWP